MRTIYRVLAYLIAALVAMQAAAIALGVFGLFAWIAGGNVLDKAAMESDTTTFAGAAGFEVHGTAGMLVIPVAALLLLAVSFSTKVPTATRAALIVLACVVCQSVLGLFAHEIYWLGAVHGMFALILFAVAAIAGRRMGASQAEAATIEPERSTVTADIS